MSTDTIFESRGGLRLEVEGAIARVFMDRGDGRNALSFDLMEALRDCAYALGRRTDIHAVILSGVGNFSVGADLKDEKMNTTRLPKLEQREALRLGPDMCAAWEAIEQITIAAVEGHCIGGGVALACSCDWRVMADDAVMRLPEIPLGINMSWQANPRLVALAGVSRAKEMVILGGAIAAERAQEWGLADRVVASGGAFGVACGLAEKVCALPPVPVRMSKQALNVAAMPLAFATSYMDREQYGYVAGGEDNREAVRAFFEKRAPKFKGN